MTVKSPTSSVKFESMVVYFHVGFACISLVELCIECYGNHAFVFTVRVICSSHYFTFSKNLENAVW